MSSSTAHNPLSPNHTSSQSYSNAAATESFKCRTKEQAIIINDIDETKLNDYMKAIGTITPPKNVVFASKISNNRICVHFTNTQIVEGIMLKYDIIAVNGTDTEIRRLITPAHRLARSNISPSVLHHIMEHEMEGPGTDGCIQTDLPQNKINGK
ncbi:hypothetical protein HHI36_017112 [Cryptolaemus montrouzieri]|uniref:Uncharacterized protein n=1 Tax=Cryptolaemus montrouzieri TaxID=559131 RepID=A0ABD2NLL0_9CUCU